jgi:iron complex outermembrane receptor protein
MGGESIVRDHSAASGPLPCLAPRPAALRLSILAITAAIFGQAAPAGAQTSEDLSDLSLQQLANIDVTSVAKSAEKLSDAAASIYVISHDDVIKSGATTIPEMLRLAPNLEVVQLNSYSYAISARGFNVGDNAALSNKLLVLIDGRSVYTPLFGGVYWDMQAVLPENIERIEVISGPGAALWGANAVDGVINIITRSASVTQGGVLTIGAGNIERMASLQYGGTIAPDLTYRVHGEGENFSHFQSAPGTDAGDGWTRPTGGFRVDWSPTGDHVSVQGDISEAQEGTTGFIEGRDLTASWQHDFSAQSNLQLLAYYDQTGRTDDSGPGFHIDTYDFEVQHTLVLGGWNSIVYGAGERYTTYDFENNGLELVPDHNGINLANIFGQDTISLSSSLKVTVGMKLEAEPYASVEPMPSLRASWKLNPDVLLWAAVSRAVRSATPVDVSFQEFGGPIDVLNGSSSFRPEALTAYEAGLRVQAGPAASFSLSGYYDRYDNLRSIEPAAAADPLPLHFANLAAGHVFGLEAWGNWQATNWWRLSAGLDLLHEALGFRAGSSQFGGLDFIANDPSHQFTLNSTVSFSPVVSWNADMRYVGALPHPAVPGYTELNSRVAWDVTHRLQLSLVGYNLVHAHHIEFYEPGNADEVPRSFFLQARWKF